MAAPPRRLVHIEGAPGMLCGAAQWYALPPEETAFSVSLIRSGAVAIGRVTCLACKAELARRALEASGEH